eukprot:GHVR01166113.1.p1 GENE.GHVR01166113.1~~GHVR01166113.1.p1  ORF type:complete len:490 (-),score=74.95 GHVR01166113.1:31-1500(-)
MLNRIGLGLLFHIGIIITAIDSNADVTNNAYVTSNADVTSNTIAVTSAAAAGDTNVYDDIAGTLSEDITLTPVPSKHMWYNTCELKLAYKRGVVVRTCLVTSDLGFNGVLLKDDDYNDNRQQRVIRDQLLTKERGCEKKSLITLQGNEIPKSLFKFNNIIDSHYKCYNKKQNKYMDIFTYSKMNSTLKDGQWHTITRTASPPFDDDSPDCMIGTGGVPWSNKQLFFYNKVLKYYSETPTDVNGQVIGETVVKLNITDNPTTLLESLKKMVTHVFPVNSGMVADQGTSIFARKRGPHVHFNMGNQTTQIRRDFFFATINFPDNKLDEKSCNDYLDFIAFLINESIIPHNKTKDGIDIIKENYYSTIATTKEEYQRKKNEVDSLVDSFIRVCTIDKLVGGYIRFSIEGVIMKMHILNNRRLSDLSPWNIRFISNKEMNSKRIVIGTNLLQDRHIKGIDSNNININNNAILYFFKDNASNHNASRCNIVVSK